MTASLQRAGIILFLFLWFYPIGLYSQSLPVYNVIKGDIQQSTGYYFIHAYKPNVSAAEFKSMILDRYGEIVFIKHHSFNAGDFKLHPNGKMSYIYSPPGIPAALKYYIMDSTFRVIDSVRCPTGTLTDGHDIVLLPNGGYLLMGFVNRTMNLSSYYWFSGNGSPGSAAAQVKCGVIQELDANKNVVFSWNSADHYQFSDVQEEWLFNPNNVDWTHFNSVEKDTDGNILVSVRHFSEVTKINRQTGNIMWRFGGKRNQFNVTGDPLGFYGQHDARRTAAGTITLFDNGENTVPVHPARGVEYQLNEQNLTAQLVWSYAHSPNSFSSFTGGTRRLENGNTIIGWGALRNANMMFSTVKPDGGLIMGVSFPDTQFTYRAFNFPVLPWQLNRPQITCRDSAGAYFLDAPSGHASYRWSTGATSRSIQINAADTFYVFVPYGEGYISSERVIITNLNDPCSQVAGITQVNTEIPDKFSLSQNYPNPFNPITNIKFQLPSSQFVKLVVYDVSGREVESLVSKELTAGSYEADWDASSYTSGVYFYRLSAGEFTEVKKMVLLK